MRPAASSSRSRRTLLWTLSAFVLIQAVLAAFVLSDPVLPHEDVWQRRTRRYRQRVRPDSLVVVQVGSSRTECGVCGGEAEPWLSQRLGRPVVLFNMGSVGAGPAANLINLRRRLNDGVRPDLLLLEVLPPLLNEREALEDLRPSRMPAGELRPSEVRHLAALTGRERPWLWAEWLGEQSVAAGTHRLALLSQFYPRLLSADNRRDGVRAADESGYVQPLDLSPGWSARALRAAREDYQPRLQSFRLSRRRLDLIGETVELARREGMAVALVLMPEGPTFRGWYPPSTWADIFAALEELSARHAVPLINLREALDEEDLFDSHHATVAGARKLTKELARRVEPLLKDVEGNPR